MICDLTQHPHSPTLPIFLSLSHSASPIISCGPHSQEHKLSIAVAHVCISRHRVLRVFAVPLFCNKQNANEF